MGPRQNPLKLAYIVPRYGPEIVGGAENLARSHAEELARRGIDVTVLTTQALSHHTWLNHYPAGRDTVNGVKVIRFPAETNLGDPNLHGVLHDIARGRNISEDEQLIWLDGVVRSPELIEYLAVHGKEYSRLIFLPYLFGTTYFGSKLLPDRSYIIPCLHDEPFAHKSLIQKMLKSAGGLIFNSVGEQKLATRLLGIDKPGHVVGMGFVGVPGDGSAFRNRHPVRGKYLLYAGRREDGKNTPLLIGYFNRFIAENPWSCSLVLIGAGEVEIPPRSSHLIFDLGTVSERQVRDSYDSSFAFCQPSVNESFSIVLMESWLAGKPALVHRECDVTRDHVRASGGGLAFGNYPEFAESLKLLLEDESLAARMGKAGREYVEKEYNWDSVVERLYKALGV
ncbi:MAG: glycosyltransferase family 4 protein [Actinobacteria bacterium]|nr:glycosyltransferase family 4 protein [Actinomycetota bacterium]